jgi:hypothetical protein
MPAAATTAIAPKSATGSVDVPSVPRFLRFPGNLAPQCIAGHEHERAIKPAIELVASIGWVLSGPVGNTRPRVRRFAAYAMTGHQTDSFASPSSPKRRQASTNSCNPETTRVVRMP